jgi:hypothetical protein
MNSLAHPPDRLCIIIFLYSDSVLRDREQAQKEEMGVCIDTKHYIGGRHNGLEL